MPYLVPSEIVELLLHRHHPIRVLKCFLYPVWLIRRNKSVMLIKMCNTRSNGYLLMNVIEDGCDGVISLDCLVVSWVWRSWILFIFLILIMGVLLDHCSPLEVAQLLDLLLHHFEPHPHLELVEVLALRKMVDLVLVEALRIPYDTHPQ